ncbi:YxiF family protein [Bhargavaea cecembensis]|uniref:YxiF family protein n=1 Tax=Bhargavaea cecembensis TaxID=394098 RepID=UPI0005906981|nr:hypothetical protein [Bhargavaea cecembensis]
MSNNQKLRLQQLLFENKRAIVQEKLIQILKDYEPSGFINQNDRFELFNDVFKRIDKTENLSIFPVNENTIINTILKSRLLFKSTQLDNKALLFFKQNTEVDAIWIPEDTFFKNLEEILPFTGYRTGEMDLVFVDPQLRRGIVVEGNEYGDKLFIWNEN